MDSPLGQQLAASPRLKAKFLSNQHPLRVKVHRLSFRP